MRFRLAAIFSPPYVLVTISELKLLSVLENLCNSNTIVYSIYWLRIHTMLNAKISESVFFNGCIVGNVHIALHFYYLLVFYHNLHSAILRHKRFKVCDKPLVVVRHLLLRLLSCCRCCHILNSPRSPLLPCTLHPCKCKR